MFKPSTARLSTAIESQCLYVVCFRLKPEQIFVCTGRNRDEMPGVRYVRRAWKAGAAVFFVTTQGLNIFHIG